MLWGINNDDHNVVGTTFDPDSKTVGNDVFQLWLANRLSPSIAFAFRTVDHPDGRVVILEIPAATTAPVAFDSIQYIRIGSATPKLTDYPDRLSQLIDNVRPFSWEKGIAKSYVDANGVIELLDYPSYFKLTGQNLPDNKSGILEVMEADQLIQMDVGGRWNITNLGAILFANDLQQFEHSISRKSVRFVAMTEIIKAQPLPIDRME